MASLRTVRRILSRGKYLCRVGDVGRQLKYQIGSAKRSFDRTQLSLITQQVLSFHSPNFSWLYQSIQSHARGISREIFGCAFDCGISISLQSRSPGVMASLRYYAFDYGMPKSVHPQPLRIMVSLRNRDFDCGNLKSI